MEESYSCGKFSFDGVDGDDDDNNDDEYDGDMVMVNLTIMVITMVIGIW